MKTITFQERLNYRNMNSASVTYFICFKKKTFKLYYYNTYINIYYCIVNIIINTNYIKINTFHENN